MGTLCTVLALCAGSGSHWWFPSQRYSNMKFSLFFMASLSRLLNKQSSCLQSETQWAFGPMIICITVCSIKVYVWLFFRESWLLQKILFPHLRTFSSGIPQDSLFRVVIYEALCLYTKQDWRRTWQMCYWMTDILIQENVIWDVHNIYQSLTLCAMVSVFSPVTRLQSSFGLGPQIPNRMPWARLQPK